MRTSADPPDRPLARALRELLPDGNPLRRRCDRVETWIMVALCVMFLVGAPVAAVVAGGYVYGASIRADNDLASSHGNPAVQCAARES
jgi:hypothetical protein